MNTVGMADKEKKLILITGCTKGLGEAMAEAFVARGHTLVGCGRSKTTLSKLRNKFPDPHEFDVVNVADDGKVKKWSQHVLKKYGAPDYLINNAGVINKNAPLWKISDKEFSQVIDINIKGVVNVIRHFVPAMVRRNKGVVVNFSSGWGHFSAPDVAPYCASKHAVEGLTKSLAQELPKGMVAVPLSPGIIHTQMLESCFGKSNAKTYETPEEWAGRAVPFILKLSSKQNGQSVEVPSA